MEDVKILTAVILNYVYEVDKLLRCYSLSVGCGFSKAEITERMNTLCDDVESVIRSGERIVRLKADAFKSTASPDKYHLADNMIDY